MLGNNLVWSIAVSASLSLVLINALVKVEDRCNKVDPSKGPDYIGIHDRNPLRRKI